MNKELLLAYFKRGLIPGPSETEEAFLNRVEASPARPEWNEVPPLASVWGFSIDWVPLVYSKKKLLPWEGAIFWSDHIQLHPKLQTQNLFGNSQTEILHHESIHAARIAFNEPAFEEFLAYATSQSKWKRFLGPLFTRIWEFPLFALSLFSLWTLPVPLFFLVRLIQKHIVFHRAQKKFTFPILLCLTDNEIRTRTVQATSLRKQLIEELSTRGVRDV